MALVFLVILTILGVTAMSGASLEEKMAGNLKEQTVAFQAAETGLAAGEAALLALTTKPTIATGDAANTTYDNAGGWYDVSAPNATPVWRTHNWSANSATYSGGLTNVGAQPQYIVEELYRVDNDSLDPTKPQPPGGKVYYRITGRGTGGTSAAQAVVQGIYAKQFN